MTSQASSSRTQPICNGCWTARNPDHPSTVKILLRARSEECCYCAAPTRSGIYVRVDPAMVLHPTLHEGELISHGD